MQMSLGNARKAIGSGRKSSEVVGSGRKSEAIGGGRKQKGGRRVIIILW